MTDEESLTQHVSYLCLWEDVTHYLLPYLKLYHVTYHVAYHVTDSVSLPIPPDIVVPFYMTKPFLRIIVVGNCKK